MLLIIGECHYNRSNPPINQQMWKMQTTATINKRKQEAQQMPRERAKLDPLNIPVSESDDLDQFPTWVFTLPVGEQIRKLAAPHHACPSSEGRVSICIAPWMMNWHKTVTAQTTKRFLHYIGLGPSFNHIWPYMAIVYWNIYWFIINYLVVHDE